MNKYNGLVKKVLLATAVSLGVHSGVWAQLVAHFPMDLKQNSITELQSGKSFVVNGNLAPENVSGAEGKALRLDGYSSYATAAIHTSGLSSKTLTFSLWCAMETYPMINTDGAVNTSTVLAGNIDESKRSGFAFMLSSQGDYSFDFYAGGWKVSCKATEKMAKYSWNQLVAVVDATTGELRLYRNTELVGSQRFNGEISVGEETFMIGKSTQDVKSGPFLLNTVNGLIDDIRIYNTVLNVPEFGYKTPEHMADLSIPKERFKEDILRPVFHSMPATGWTNEPHGLTYYDGKYHLFFQKNANGPYWGRLHWGHVTSTDLYNWSEEKIALAPSVNYDWKGCWSGCVFTDEVLTDGKPHLFYTAVDNSKATIAEASPMDEHLIDWNKRTDNPVIPGRPSGLSDDFRDPYVFTSGGNYYMIVGTGKDGIGAATLHRYNVVTKAWSNDGSIFFKGRNTSIAGTFWEMPVIVPMNNGKWLFLATPLGARQGVEVLYWVGTINTDGTFAPLPAFLNEPKEVELGTMGKDGYGLLSPSLCEVDGKQVAIGIVPDKLPSQANYDLGWAHTFSLPREWTLDENNLLIQKPYSGLSSLRTGTKYAATDVVLNGVQDLSPVSGRCVEAHATFKAGSADKVGFRFFKDGNRSVEVYYNFSNNKIVVDARSTERIKNDAGSFDGLYESTLPQRLAEGSALDLHVYVDHSIMDIFINNKWAFSVRLFPTDRMATGIEAFSEGGETPFSQLNAWILDTESHGGGTGITGGATNERVQLITVGGYIKYDNVPIGALFSFYDFSGRMLSQHNVSEPNGTFAAPVSGACIVNVTAPHLNYSVKLVIE